MSAQLFEYQVQIKEAHLDTFGHVNNAAYLTLYEEARWDFITRNGYGLERIKKEMKGPVILEANVKYKRELVNREIIRITFTHKETINSKIMIYEQLMLKDNDKIASEALFTVGFFDLKERKLIEPDPDWLKAIGLK